MRFTFLLPLAVLIFQPGWAGAQQTDLPPSALLRGEAWRWAVGADMALIPTGAEGGLEGAQPLSHFWLTAEDLELLLEVGLRRAGPQLQIAGAQVRWNPLRPPYDRIFAIELLDADRLEARREALLAGAGPDALPSALLPLVGGDRLIHLVMPLPLAVEMMQQVWPWFAAPQARYRSGTAYASVHALAAVPPVIEDGPELWAQWRQQGWRQLMAQTAAGGYVGEVSLRPSVWFGRSSPHGWLMGALALAVLLLLGLLYGGKR